MGPDVMGPTRRPRLASSGFSSQEPCMTDTATPDESNARTIGYWVTNAFLALPFGLGGVADIVQPEEVAATFSSLGYPPYFGVMLGVAKLLGLAVVLAPGLRRAKEWAYAGLGFDLVAAFVSHAAVEGVGGNLIAPVVFLAILVTSWSLRPAHRKLPGDSI